MAVLTVVVIVFGWLSIRSAQDAANAAKEQVEAQTRPILNLGESGLSGFAYDDGRQIARSYHWPYELAVVGNQIYSAVRVKNEAAGHAKVQTTRIFAVFQRSFPPYIEPALRGENRRWLVAPSKSVIIAAINQADGEAGIRLARAIQLGQPVASEFFYTDISEKRRYRMDLVLARSDGRWNATFIDFREGWGPTPGLDAPSK